MKLKHIDRIVSAVAVAVWMYIIFSFSSQNAQVSASVSGGFIEAVARWFHPDFGALSETQRVALIEAWQHFVRKAAHFCEYAVLGLLVTNAVRSFGLKGWPKFTVSVAVCVLNAAGDEFHQSFVVGRAGRLSDVVLDTAGAVTGVAVFLTAGYVLKNIKNRGKHDDTQASAE